MLNTKKSSLLIAGIVLVSIFAYYSYAKDLFRSYNKPEENTQPMVAPVATGTREISVVTRYAVPEREDVVRFTLKLDINGVIISAAVEDAEKNAASDKQKEFSGLLTTRLQGMKLSELTAIDKVGKSSLTTQAFNNSLAELKSQI